jgi:glycosyl transferase family 25
LSKETTVRDPQQGDSENRANIGAISCETARPVSAEGIVAYVINLDRSIERWTHIDRQAQRFGLDVRRVAGVEIAKASPEGDWPNYDRKAFVRGNGRPMLAAEYGCYLAHLGAINAFLATDAECAVIMEDDVDLDANLLRRAQDIHRAVPSADVVKLLNHRTVLFRSTAQSVYGDQIGKCFFGPQGSAACYLITRRGAVQLVAALQRIAFPFDIALERSWATGVQVYTVKDNLIALSVRSKESQIADRARYRSIKLRGHRKIPTHLFRIVELFRRARYALK